MIWAAARSIFWRTDNVHFSAAVKRPPRDIWSQGGLSVVSHQPRHPDSNRRRPSPASSCFSPSTGLLGAAHWTATVRWKVSIHSSLAWLI